MKVVYFVEPPPSWRNPGCTTAEGI